MLKGEGRGEKRRIFVQLFFPLRSCWEGRWLVVVCISVGMDNHAMAVHKGEGRPAL